MAKCKGCGTAIPDGSEYCEACLTKLNTAKDSESYLDSLLNAVMTEEPERREIVFPKREASSLVSMPKTEDTVVEEPELPDLSELFAAEEAMEEESPLAVVEPDDFSMAAVAEALEKETEDAVWDDFLTTFADGLDAEDAFPESTDEAPAEQAGVVDGAELPEELFPEEEPPMEDTLGMFFDASTDLPDLKSYSIFGDVDESAVDRMLAEELGETVGFFEDESGSFSEDGFEEKQFTEPDDDAADVFEEEVPMDEIGAIEDLFGALEDARGADAPDEIKMAEAEVLSAEEFENASDMFSGIVESAEEDSTEADSLFAEPQEEDAGAMDFGELADLFGNMEEDTPEAAPAAQSTEAPADFGDFADLFANDEVSFESAPLPEADSAPETTGQSSDDFADLFADFDGGGLFEFGAEPIEMDSAESAEVQDELLAAVVPDGAKQSVKQDGAEASLGKEKREKQNAFVTLFHKLFDNVKVDPSKIKKQPTKEEIEAKKKAKQEEKERSKEEKDALLAEKKEQEKQVKLEKQRVIKEAKAEKKARKMEEAKLLLEEMEKTRINRAGASIVFIFFAMIAVVIIVGTSLFSYSVSIRNAEYEFKRDEYTLAYNEIYGLEIKNEDIVLYDRIMTVMYVQKQLNSYYNYYGLNDKPKALDSLLKGLQRYEKYIDLAVELEIDSDLDLVRKKILKEISTVFQLSEQEAMEIIQSDNQVEYSKRVYDAVEELE